MRPFGRLPRACPSRGERCERLVSFCLVRHARWSQLGSRKKALTRLTLSSFEVFSNALIARSLTPGALGSMWLTTLTASRTSIGASNVFEFRILCTGTGGAALSSSEESSIVIGPFELDGPACALTR